MSRSSRLLTLLALPLLLLPACQLAGGDGAHAATGHTEAIVDSTVSREDALRTFQASVPPADSLSGGSASRDALVQRFVTALQARDTAALTAMTLTASEFGYLYYPTNPQSLPPYELPADLMWFLLRNRGEIGISRALREYGGSDLGHVGHACADSASREGANVVWGPCVLRRRLAAGDTVADRLFGLIIEREGRYKFVSYANQLD